MTTSDAAMVSDVREAVGSEIDRLEQKLTRLRQARSVLGGMLGDPQEARSGTPSVHVITPALPASPPGDVAGLLVEHGVKGERKLTKARKTKAARTARATTKASGKGSRPRMTPEQLNEFRTMWADRVPTMTIAAHFNRDKTWVHWRARSLGLPIRTDAPPSKPVQQPRTPPRAVDPADPLDGVARRCPNCDQKANRNPCPFCGHRA